jgi:hypothetical protein
VESEVGCTVGDGLAEERGVTGVVAMGFKSGTKIQGEGIA